MPTKVCGFADDELARRSALSKRTFEFLKFLKFAREAVLFLSSKSNHRKS